MITVFTGVPSLTFTLNSNVTVAPAANVDLYVTFPFSYLAFVEAIPFTFMLPSTNVTGKLDKSSLISISDSTSDLFVAVIV